MPKQAYEKIEYLDDPETPDNTGWWIVYYNPDGTSHDAVGPYESEQEATKIQQVAAASRTFAAR
ncbi:hypothetical protein [Mesorhizobium sp. M1216]|uniref:hypothetical protein n=1 Tax=Mesorhizobium sp. M1216 TaxID=2957069 RepID=UPI00333AEB11